MTDEQVNTGGDPSSEDFRRVVEPVLSWLRRAGDEGRHDCFSLLSEDLRTPAGACTEA